MKSLALTTLAAIAIVSTMETEACVQVNKDGTYTVDKQGYYRNAKSHSKEKRPPPIRIKNNKVTKK